MTSTTLPRAPGKINDLVLLTKIRLNALVVATAGGGYFMGASTIDWASLLVACLGTGLVAGGAAALNQVDERDLDRLMIRTRERPVAEGRMSAGEGRIIALIFALAGLIVLWFGSTAAAAAVALITLSSYILIYTPLKRRTSLATVVGAFPGALPPVIGWAAAGGELASPAPWSLFLLMFFWQLPHFLAIAWMYREDYARAQLPMLPVKDPHGRLTAQQAVLWASTLIPISELPFLLGLTGPIYAVAALTLGLGLLTFAFRFLLRRTNDDARALFFASITYLPILWTVMAIGKT